MVEEVFLVCASMSLRVVSIDDDSRSLRFESIGGRRITIRVVDEQNAVLEIEKGDDE